MYTKRRMNRIFRADGRSLIVAMDHVGFMNKPVIGLVHAHETIALCVANGADAIMTTPGTARTCLKQIDRAALILTIPSYEKPAIDLAVENGLRLGADAIKVLVFPFLNNPEPSMLNLTWLGAECAAWGMPLLAETIPGGWTAQPDMRTPEALAGGVRVAFEAGADFVKTFPTADPTQFRIVAENCPGPVVVLGGEKAASDRDLLRTVKTLVDSGAAGVAMGRNLWGHPHPDRLTAALVAILHKNAEVDQALKESDLVSA
jgi:DhnA family fructose-bisphosphate aldolase class Ia